MFEVTHLPKRYSPEDRARCDALMGQVAALQQEFEARAQPLRQALIEIENRYVDTVMLVPKNA